jgi:large subunit ribosomal protein L18
LAEDASYRVKYRRRREGKTDYQARRILATSGRPRLVVRASLRNIRVQLTSAELEGDHIEVSTSSHELVNKFGWKGGGKNTSASYLLGLIAGYKALSKGIETSMLDMELRSPTKGARVFALFKGAVDSGLSIAHSEEVLPADERIRGEHIANYARTLADNQEAYQKRFSQYFKRGLKPEQLPEHFEQVKARIQEAFAS